MPFPYALQPDLVKEYIQVQLVAQNEKNKTFGSIFRLFSTTLQGNPEQFKGPITLNV